MPMSMPDDGISRPRVFIRASVSAPTLGPLVEGWVAVLARLKAEAERP